MPSKDAQCQIKLGWRLVSPGVQQPTVLAQPADGSHRWFVGELAGRIRIIDASENLRDSAFLDLGSSGLDRIVFTGETGILSLAFHPNYAVNGRFFVYYVRKSDGADVLAEYSVSSDPNVASPTESLIIAVPHPFFNNHNGGHIAFGPDGLLYLSIGDGGFNTVSDPFRNGQNKNTLLGKILRIDIDSAKPYAIPPDNPFVVGFGAAEIWAYGLRNPWRISFDRLTGRLFAGDVGYLSFEEIDLIEKGKNYGWSLMEGPNCFPNPGFPCNLDHSLTLPIAAVPRNEGQCVTGGYVYRGSRFPELYGLYIFGDWLSGAMFSLEEDPGGSWTRKSLGTFPFSITSFAESEEGELYFANFFAGEIYELLGYYASDLNSDFSVDEKDLCSILKQMGGAQPPPGTSSADLNSDGKIDYQDLFSFQDNWKRDSAE